MSERETTTVAIACQGGGSHTAFTAGVLRELIRNRPDGYEVGALSGTSGGAICAALAWDGLRRGDEQGAIDRLDGFWEATTADSAWERLVNAGTVWGGRLTDEFGSFGVSPYRHTVSVQAQQQLRATIERFVDFDDDVPSAPPHLYVGAVDVESGSFEVFEDGAAGVDALLASAAIPTLFRAVDIGGHGHWDGLFSQNPPVRHFVSDTDVEEKPDEIWVLRINPTTTDRTPRSLADIANRRNELAGNLSLEQELHLLESITELVRRGVITDEWYKQIEIRELTLDADLDLQSKLDRRPSFIEELQRRGESTARTFLAELDG